MGMGPGVKVPGFFSLVALGFSKRFTLWGLGFKDVGMTVQIWYG